MANIRTFIAAEVPSGIRATAERQIQGLQRAGAEFRWIQPAQLHLTLRFLGNMLDREIPELCRVVTEAVAGCEPIQVGVRGLGAFPNWHSPKVIWMGLGPDLRELQDLHRRVNQGLQKMGFPLERGDYRPHLTLGRIPAGGALDASVQTYLEAHLETDFGSMEIDEVVVFSSFLDREGTTHTPMATIGLDG